MADLTTVLVSPPPKYSLSVSVSVFAGIAQTTRTLGQYTGFYPSLVSTSGVYTELAPSQVQTGGSTSALFLSTDQPVTFVGTKADTTTVTVTVSTLLFLDQPFTSWTVTNGSSTNTANVFVSASLPSTN